jgi:diguanylate cyclase (GGDEF)-like protein
MLVGAGSAGSAVDAANILKPALARGELQCIGSTTLDEYRKHIESDTARETDLVVRYGGEEFIMLLPHTDAVRARTVAERVRRATSSRTFTADEAPLKLTVSCGVATYPANPGIKSEEDLVRAADEALYVAKKAGRNRTAVDPDSMRDNPPHTGRPGQRAAAD